MSGGPRQIVSAGCFHGAMSTVHETAALLPDPAQLRAHLRALAVLDATIGDDPRFCCSTFDATWAPAQRLP